VIRAGLGDGQLVYGSWLADGLAAALDPCTWAGDSRAALPALYTGTVNLNEAGKYYFVLASTARWSLDGTCKAIEVTVADDGTIAVAGYNLSGSSLGTANDSARLSYHPDNPDLLVVSWGSLPDGNIAVTG
jgi:hypothetical protein